MNRLRTALPLLNTPRFLEIPITPTLLSPRYFSSAAKLGSAASAPVEMSASVKANVDKAIKEHDVVVFGKSWCSFSRRARNILAQETQDVYVLDIDETDEEDQIQGYLRQLNGQSTVPHIYIRQQFIGGCSDLTKIPKPVLKARIAGKA